jgi:uncharacterized membrane protein
MTAPHSSLVDRLKGTFLHRFIASRPHLALAVAFGMVVALLLPDSLALMTRALIAWNAAVWGFLATMMRVITNADHHRVRGIAAKEDEKAPLVLVVLIVASIVSLSAIFFEMGELGDSAGWERSGHYALTVATLMGSWLLVGMLFCFHYAHLYYRSAPNALPFKFPDGEKEPDYWDFLFFSFTIAVAVQTSDVAVMTRAMRKLVLGHSVLSFFFNLIILGLSVNIAAGLART